ALDRQAANQHPNPNFGRAIQYANRIAQIVQEATETDQLWAPKLRELKADDDLVVSDKDWIDTEKDTGGVRSGAESNAEWWKGLSQDERDAYVALYPDRVGKLDGLPAVDRDEANRTILDQTRARYQTELDAIPPEPWNKYKIIATGGYPAQVMTDEYAKWYFKYHDRRDFLKGSLDGMKRIQQRFDDTGNEHGLPEAYLLGFDPEANHDGRIILANGNPDTADHTAVYVPGSKTLLSTIGGNISKSEKLWRESTALAPGESVSTIMWFDYDAPRSAKPGEAGDLIPEAASDSRAAEGAPRLRHFLDGRVAAHQTATGGAGHSTLLGHSYGTTLMGDAAKYRPDYHHSWADPLPVDDVVTVASPGVQAKRPGDLGLDPKHWWAMAAPDDDVPFWGKQVGLGDDRIIPTDSEFGGNIMETDTKGHGGYWDYKGSEPSVSLTNQAKVIVGRYGDVKLKEEAHG
ncbi:hypothetical protein ACZ90_56720, partial [Streptomyces albus subsp. albus]